MAFLLQGVGFDADRPLFSDVTMTIGPGVHGLVGANGAGKSTLLALLAGKLAPTTGTIVRTPRDAIVELVAQEASSPTDAMRALADDASRDAVRLRNALALDPQALDRFASLSPGERKRWQLGAALAAPADVLLLDEPTNHLDVDGRKRLVSAMRRASGTIVVVSHDRALLDELTTHTLRIHHETVTQVALPYSAAKQQWDDARAAAVAARAVEKTRVEKAKIALDRARRTHESARAQTSRSARMRDKNDSDARGMMAQVSAEYAEATLGRRAARLRDALGDKVGKLEAIEVEPELGRSLFVGHAASARPRLLARDRAPIDVHGRTIDVPALVVDRGAKIWLTGRNGAGKTTLLRALFGERAFDVRASDERDVVCVPQDLGPAEGTLALARVGELGPDARGKVASLVAALGVDPSHLLARRDGSTLSHGEIRKTWLALALTRSTGLVVLDEPTNHLDLPSIERLEAALAAFPGALVIVTHDEALAREVTRTRWHVGEDALVVTDTAPA